MSNILSVKKICFSYAKKEKIFNNLNFEVDSNGIICLTGKNGSGKTTLLYCLSGIYKLDSGAITLNGNPIENKKEKIYLIDSKNDLFEYLTIVENIRFFLQFYNCDINSAQIDYYLKRYNLYQQQAKYVFEASRGMIKKTQIIIALLVSPVLLLADEPMEGLDQIGKDHLVEDFLNLNRSRESIVFFSTHHNSIMDVCDKNLNLDEH